MIGKATSEFKAKSAAEEWVKTWCADGCPDLKEAVVASPFKLLPKEDGNVRNRRR